MPSYPDSNEDRNEDCNSRCDPMPCDASMPAAMPVSEQPDPRPRWLRLMPSWWGISNLRELLQFVTVGTSAVVIIVTTGWFLLRFLAWFLPQIVMFVKSVQHLPF